MRKVVVVDGMVLMLISCCQLVPVCCAQQSGWRGALLRMAGSGKDSGLSGQVLAGEWRGGKTQNDPVHGGFLNMEYRFNFMSNGTYQETATMGGRQVMAATGTYEVGPARKQDDRSVTNRLSFLPTACRFTSDALAGAVKLFPIPTDRALAVYVGLGPAEAGGRMTLEDMSQGGDSWSLKPMH